MFGLSKFIAGVTGGLISTNVCLALGIEFWECKANSGEVLTMDITGDLDPPDGPNPNHPKGEWYSWGIGRIEFQSGVDTRKFAKTAATFYSWYFVENEPSLRMRRSWYWPLDRDIDYRDPSSLTSFIDSLVNPLQKEEPNGHILILGPPETGPKSLFVMVFTPDEADPRYDCYIKEVIRDISKYAD